MEGHVLERQEEEGEKLRNAKEFLKVICGLATLQENYFFQNFSYTCEYLIHLSYLFPDGQFILSFKIISF